MSITKKRLGIVNQDDRDNLMNEEHALRSAATFLSERMNGRQCDSEGAASCERCATNFLADRVLYALQQDVAATSEEPTP